jgi:prephenate dehydrogenase
MSLAGGGRLLVVGTGLMGTSLGLAARAGGLDVTLTDPDPDHLRLAAERGAGTPVPWEGLENAAVVDLAVVAAPPLAIAAVAGRLLQAAPRTVVSHMASVQSHVERELRIQHAPLAAFVGGHPIAGRELSGPRHASGEIFRDRAWIVCPTPETRVDAEAAVEELARVCGGTPVVMSAIRHDEVFARLSHVPQLVASALAAGLAELDAAAVGLAGSGLRDTTRLADSDPDLWSEVAAANSEELASGLRDVAARLSAVADRLARGDGADAVRDLMRTGRAGRALLPGKHGGAAAQLLVLRVLVPDSPGALANLLTLVAEAGVNVEDVHVEHEPGQPVGTAELAIAPAARDRLTSVLEAAGWEVSAGALRPL